MIMENSPPTIAPLLLRNILTSVFIFADKPFMFLAEKHKLLELIHCCLVSVFLFFLRFLPPSIPSDVNFHNCSNPSLKQSKKENFYTQGAAGGGGYYGGGDSGVGRGLSQLLSLVNDVPVSSRKYEVVRSLAEKLIDENLENGNERLREINFRVLSVAFQRMIRELEGAMVDCRMGDVYVNESESGLSQFVRGVGWYVRMLWQGRKGLSGGRRSPEKLAAEVLWLGRKMVGCGCGEEAVRKWSSATRLAWLALSIDQRVQSLLVKVSAFLFKQAKEIGIKEGDEVANDELSRMKMRMLMLWLPLLCKGSNGTDTPVLSMAERGELEKTLEDMIETLEDEEDREKVLSLWLQHFTHSAASDWPNLQECYTRWYTASRGLLLEQS